MNSGMVLDFEKREVIGNGSFGIVYRAEDRRGMEMALKEIILVGFSEEEIEQTTKEATLLASIHNPFIIKHYGHSIRDQVLTIAMEFANLGSLEKFIGQRSERLEEDFLLGLFAQVVLGVDHIHSKGIIHRDLSARNILLTEMPNGICLKLGDFGISKLAESSGSLSGSGQSLTVEFSHYAPELFEGSPHTRKSDMWAVGCILYLLATLEPPFRANDFENLEEVMNAVMRTKLTLPDNRYDSKMKELMKDLLNRNRFARPTARQLLSHPYLTYHIHLKGFGC